MAGKATTMGGGKAPKGGKGGKTPKTETKPKGSSTKPKGGRSGSY